MDSSPAGEDPQKSFEVEVFDEHSVDNLDSHDHVLPAEFADGRSSAAAAHIVVVTHIDIEDHLFFERNESLSICGVVLGRSHIVDSSNIDLVRDLVLERLVEVLCLFEAEVAAVDVILQSERKFALIEVL